MGRPFSCYSGVLPLAEFDTPFSLPPGPETANGIIGTIATVGRYQIAMVDSTGTHNLATASALNSAGNSFTDTWLNSC